MPRSPVFAIAPGRRMRRASLWRIAIVLWAAALALLPVTLFSQQTRADAPRVTAHGSEGSFAPAPDAPTFSGRLELPPPPSTFTTVDRGWLRISFPPGNRERVRDILREADAVKGELSLRLGERVLDHVYVRVARTPGEMTTLAPEGAPYPRYASGVAYPEIGLVLLTLTPESASALHDVGEIFRHELAHVALADAIGETHHAPRWFNEGLAVHLSRESPLLRIKTLSTATLAGRLIPLSRLDDSFPADAGAANLAYAEAADVVRYLLRQEDTERFPQLIQRLREGQPFGTALKDAYGIDASSLEYEWREDVARRYSFWPVFFSGSAIWIGVLVLFGVGWKRRRKRSRETLERWAREEAVAELRRARALMPEARVHILLPGTREAEASELPPLNAPPPEAEVPKVEHDGQWHTLH